MVLGRAATAPANVFLYFIPAWYRMERFMHPFDVGLKVEQSPKSTHMMHMTLVRRLLIYIHSNITMYCRYSIPKSKWPLYSILMT